MQNQTRLMFLLLALLVGGCLVLDQTASVAPAADYDLKLAASQLTAECFARVRARRLELGIEIDPSLDPNLTGLIGPSFSGITTTLGHLEAKRTTTNPNFAAILVDCFTEVGLKPGDRVALNFSGSFPNVNIATLCAVEVMGLDPVIMSSVGASSYGGNMPQFTYPEMELLLYEAGLVSHRSLYVSMGGGKDLGSDMFPEDREAVTQRLIAAGLDVLFLEDVDENLDFRWAAYNAGADVKCFVNVGGNMLSFAGSDAMIDLQGGVVTALPDAAGDRGLIQRYVRAGVPVVHMLNMRDLAVRYGLPVDPAPVPEPGEGGCYYAVRYHRAMAGLMLIAAAVALNLIGGKFMPLRRYHSVVKPK